MYIELRLSVRLECGENKLKKINHFSISYMLYPKYKIKHEIQSDCRPQINICATGAHIE